MADDIKSEMVLEGDLLHVQGLVDGEDASVIDRLMTDAERWMYSDKAAYFDEKFCMERRRYKNLYVYKDEYQYPVRAMVNHINPDMRDFVNQQRKQGTFLGFVNYVASNNGL